MDAGARVGPELTTDAEREHRQGQLDAYVTQLESEVDAIGTKLHGMKAALADKKDELKQARAAAREG